MRAGPRASSVAVGWVFSLLLVAATARAELIARSGDVIVAPGGSWNWFLSCPDVAVGSDGAAVAVWSRIFSGNSIGSVWARRLESDGGLGPEIRLVEEHIEDPHIVAFESGGYVAQWTRTRGRYFLAGTVLQHLDAQGAPLGDPRLLERFYYAKAAPAGDRLALLGLRRWDGPLILRLLDREGADVFPPRQVAKGEILGYAVTNDGAGGLVVAWTILQRRALVVFAQAFDPAGQPRTPPIAAGRFNAWPLSSPALAAGAGRFAVAWSQESEPMIQLRVWTLDGELVAGPPVLWFQEPLPFVDTHVALVSGPQGVTVVWDQRSGDLYDLDVVAASFDWNGHALERGFSLPARDHGAEHCGRLATNGRGDWAAAWTEVSPVGDYRFDHVEARTFSEP